MPTEIPKDTYWEKKVFQINNAESFRNIALEVFDFQFQYNSLYQEYCTALHKQPGRVNSINEIPFLPITFFKTHQVKTTAFDPQLVFESSGTSGMTTSTHYVKSSQLYETSFSNCFEQFFGIIEGYCVLGLLPSYLERKNSSLVYMVSWLIEHSKNALSGFYLYDFKKLSQTLQKASCLGQKVILFGVTYALLDFAEQYSQPLENVLIVETGGMKGRKEEMIKQELYTHLKKAFGISQIYSEYGMTELLSQGYALEGIFKTPPWMKILLRDETDPFAITESTDKPITGAVNVIDLANIYSCCFIATDDLGRLHPDNSFELSGRMDNSDIRGCSLMVV